MKKLLFAAVMAVSMSLSAAFAAGIDEGAGNAVKLQIGNPLMNACGLIKEVDAGRGTAPVIDSDYTLVPIRAVIESFGGWVNWDEETRTVYITGRESTAIVTIDSTDAVVRGRDEDKNVTLAVAPKIINGRTMVPLRFVSESIGLEVDWDGAEQVITITEPKAEPVTFANFDGSFYPIGDLLDVRMGAKDTVAYKYGGKEYAVTTDIVSFESLDFDKIDPDTISWDTPLSSITVDGTNYPISNVYNFEYAGIADLSPNADGFEIILVDRGMSEDYTVTVFTYNQHGLVCTNTYAGMTYSYYGNGTGTVYCDNNGHIINKYIGFTDPMYAFDVNTIMGGDGIVVLDGEYTELDVDAEGKELVFGMDLFADYRAVDEYPEKYEDIWQAEQGLMTIKKGTPVIIDKIVYWTDEETGEKSLDGFYARIDGKKYVIQLGYAG